jgi:hypothetical protein
MFLDKLEEIQKKIKNGEYPGVITDDQYEARLKKDPAERQRRINAALKYIRDNRNG